MGPKNNPTIGVVILAYNNARWINESVDSVINQTYPPSQIVICDDDSADGTRNIVRAYEKAYPGLVEAIYQPRNVGAAANRNSGLRKICQDYVSTMASDDTWHPDKLRLEIERLTVTPEARWAYSRVELIDEEGKFLRLRDTQFTGREGNIIFPMVTNHLKVCSPLVELSLVRKAGYFDEELLVSEDWDYHIRLAALAPIAWVPSLTVRYRIHNQGLSSSPIVVRLKYWKKTCDKHAALINRLPPDQRSQVKTFRRVRWSFFSRRAVLEELKKGSNWSAFKYWWEGVFRGGCCDIRLLTIIILPAPLYNAVRSIKAAVRPH